MVNFYVRRIKAGKMTVSAVPSYWYEDVKAVFDEMLENGEITEEEYAEYMGE